MPLNTSTKMESGKSAATDDEKETSTKDPVNKDEITVHQDNVLRNAEDESGEENTTVKHERVDTPEREGQLMNIGKQTSGLWLTFCLRLFLYSPIKAKRKGCWISLCHVGWFFLYVAKLALLTHLTFQIGYCRQRVSSIIEDGYIALHHTLLQKWDASYETLPYPPSQGKFAVYNTEDLTNSINYAVEKFYNAESEATGYFIKLPDDDVTIHLVYFDLIDDPEHLAFKDVKTNVQRNFKPDHGLSKYWDEIGRPKYSYNVTLDLIYNNVSTVLERILELKIVFSLHSLRVDRLHDDSRCLRIQGNVSYSDKDHNGQVIVDLSTHTLPIKCKRMNFSLTDSPQCRDFNKNVAVSLQGLTFTTICGDIIIFLGGIISLIKTYCYMKTNYQHLYKDTNGGNLPLREYFGNVQWWHIPSIAGDAFIILGLKWILEKLGDNDDLEDQPLNSWDTHVVYIGSGCLLSWFSLLRFIKINHKFTLLFKTLSRSAIDVIFFLVCVVIIFVGFWSCTYVVLGPYHVKFQQLSTTAEALFSMINGDEIFATFALLQEEYVGDLDRVWWFSRIMIYAYVTLFTILVFNLLIALFNSAYEVVKKSYEQQKTINKDSIPKTLSVFMNIDLTKDSGRCFKVYNFDHSCPPPCRCNINNRCTCGMFTTIIHFISCNLLTVCCCRCKTDMQV